MRRSLTALAVLTAALLAPAAQAGAVDAESAATTPTATTPAPPPPAIPAPKAGKAKIEIADGIATRKLRYVARGDRLVVEGKVHPFVPGQVAQLEVRRSGKVVGRKRAKIRRAGHGAGRVRLEFKTRRKGVYKLVVRHRATAEQKAFRSRAVRVKAVVLSAGEGARGTAVVLLQRGLAKLGYAVPGGGYYDAGTSRAVLAFNKNNGLTRNGYASSKAFSYVLQGRGTFRPRYAAPGKHVEFDWSRQVLALIQDGRAHRIYHASSGKPSTPTVFGTFQFYRKEPGTNGHGMVQSNYFIGGYAIHGYVEVPAYAASHGCIRVPIPNAYQIDAQIDLGETIYVYR